MDEQLARLVGSGPHTDIQLKSINATLMRATETLTITNVEYGMIFFPLAMEQVEGAYNVGIRTLRTDALKEANAGLSFVQKMTAVLLTSLRFNVGKKKEEIMYEQVMGRWV